ncbi:MAG TPA: hypothetical protein VFL80_03735 [Thermoanaerobaculia bacterium]|nr:hypothetical protein [Thermoanaerobaculia bacterium]
MTDTPGGSYTPPPPPPSPPAEGGGAGGGDIIRPTQPPKDPILILVLNLLVAGCVGYFLIAQKTKGIVALIAWIVLLPLTCGVGSGVIGIVTAIDGFLQAQHLQQGRSIGQWTMFNQSL